MKNEELSNAIEYAFTNNITDMKDEIEKVLQYKIINALEQVKIEQAKTILNKEDISDRGIFGTDKSKTPVSTPITKPITSNSTVKVNKPVTTKPSAPPITDRGLF